MFDWWNTTQYLPGLLFAMLSGALTGVVAALVAFFTARHEVREADKRRQLEEQVQEKREALEQIEREAQEERNRREVLAQGAAKELADSVSQLIQHLHSSRYFACSNDLSWIVAANLRVMALLFEDRNKKTMAWMATDWLEFIKGIRRNISRSTWPLLYARKHCAINLRLELHVFEHIFTRWSTQPVSLWEITQLDRALLEELREKASPARARRVGRTGPRACSARSRTGSRSR